MNTISHRIAADTSPGGEVLLWVVSCVWFGFLAFGAVVDPGSFGVLGCFGVPAGCVAAGETKAEAQWIDTTRSLAHRPFGFHEGLVRVPAVVPCVRDDPPRNHFRSNRSRSITFVQAATKSETNFFFPSELP